TITIAVEEGLIVPKTPGIIRMEAPAGLVLINYTQEPASIKAGEPGNRNKVKSVKLTNIPAYLAATELTVECPDLGELVIDVSYGGNFYAIVDVQKNFKGLEHYAADKLIAWARELRKRINRQYQFVHPEDPTINGCSHILWAGAVLDERSTAR